MSDLKIFTKNIEEKALHEINTLISQPAFSDCKIRIMPDVHAGMGCVIGFTANLGEVVIPNIVGVDIGCGMRTVKLKNKDIDLEKLDNVIRTKIPSGRNTHSEKNVEFDLSELHCYNYLKNINRLESSIGTLGGGNHFIEVDVDSDNNKYLIIHTGSRNLGKQVADYYQQLAIMNMDNEDSLINKRDEIISEYKKDGRESEIESAIVDLYKTFHNNIVRVPKELCYLTGKYREEYLHDMKICQMYAIINRKTIVDIIVSEMGFEIDDYFETIHNYIDHSSNIVRKGAISARKYEKLLIPINMKDGCILGYGKGNEDWNCSAPHGAGRIMSRTEAKSKLQLDDYKKSMEGIFTTSVNIDTIDEAPSVYKPIEEIIENIKDTVDIIDILKPIYNFKASE